MDESDVQHAPVAVERFVKQLVVTLKAVTLYPPASVIPGENAAVALKLLSTVIQGSAECRLAVQKNGLLFGHATVFPGQTAFESFAQELYNRGLAEVRFHTGVTSLQIISFLGILKIPPVELAAAGGFESRLWELGVDAITVKMATARIFDAEELGLGADADADWPPTPTRIDEILAEALGGRPRDQRLLVRVLSDPRAIESYLRETLAGRGVDPAEALKELRLTEIARAVAGSPSEAQAPQIAAIAKAIGALDPEVRRALLIERLLPEARTDENVAAIVRHLGVENVCAWLAEGMAEQPDSVEGIARALRNLATISQADRDAVAEAASSAVRATGAGEELASLMREAVSPTRLTVRPERGVGSQGSAVDAVLKLVDLAPGSIDERFEGDEAFAALQEESRRGILDGDVVGSLVTLVHLDSGGTGFEPMMTLLEDTLELTVERGDYDVAADAAQALVRIAGDADLAQERRERVSAALTRMASAGQISLVTKAMRMYGGESPEHHACERLIGALGASAIEPLLTVLADEPDMSARKALVDTIASMAGSLIDVLGEHVSDPRWYFVRNVIAIIGGTRDPEALPHLSRTLRHSDARVRRETIRALSGIHDRLAAEMLVAALEDPDAQNVQLAARYLGVSRERGALGALVRVAQGEGTGNRDTAPRVEAVEALGRLGSPEALPVLEQLAGKRALVRGARVREIATAATRAIATINATQGGERP